jgi:putative Holliday junction resolvase
MKVASLDVRMTRIGVAVSGPDSRTAQPIGTIERRSLSDDLKRLSQELTTRNIELIVIGLPLNMDGTEGWRAREMRAFAEAIARGLGVPVELHDERLTTFEAHERLRGVPLRRAKRRELFDSLAAALILESWLERSQQSRNG